MSTAAQAERTLEVSRSRKPVEVVNERRMRFRRCCAGVLQAHREARAGDDGPSRDLEVGVDGGLAVANGLVEERRDLGFDPLLRLGNRLPPYEIAPDYT